jgi:hypothetical protein
VKVPRGFTDSFFDHGGKTTAYRALIVKMGSDFSHYFSHFLWLSALRCGDPKTIRQHFTGFHVDQSPFDSRAAHIYSEYFHVLILLCKVLKKFGSLEVN